MKKPMMTLKINAQGMNSIQRVIANLHYIIEEKLFKLCKVWFLYLVDITSCCLYIVFFCFFSFMLELEELSYVLEFN